MEKKTVNLYSVMRGRVLNKKTAFCSNDTHNRTTLHELYTLYICIQVLYV